MYKQEVLKPYFDINKLDCTDFKDWYFGHLYEDTDVENFHCRIDEVTQIE